MTARAVPVHPLRDALTAEARFDRPYDEQTASHLVVHRDDRQTLAGSYHRPLLAAMTRQAINQELLDR